MTPVLLVDVLNHLLPALVFEIDVDIGRLIAFLRDKSLDEHGHACRVDLGYTQAETYGRVGCRTTPLAQNALRAGKRHDVVHGQEIGLVTKLGNEFQFVSHKSDNAFRHAARPAPFHPRLGELAKVTCGRFVCRNDFIRVFVTDFIQREINQRRNAQGLGKQRCRVDAGESIAAAQMTLTVRVQVKAGLVKCCTLTNGRQRILQYAAPATMHMYVTTSDQWQLEALADRCQVLQALGLAAIGQEFDGNPQAIAKSLAEPVVLGVEHTEGIGHPQNETIRQTVFATLPG